MTMNSKIYQDLPKDSAAYKEARKRANQHPNTTRWRVIKTIVTGWLVGYCVTLVILVIAC